MAGIISNVDSDVQKLRKLKNEIENVKKALMGINIKVDIDIAKGLQSQLTSLLGQYDVLVDKIAAAEAKIMLSTSRINKATEKIVQAQEQVSKPAGIPTQSGNTSTQTNTAETASIQAQAKAYDDLRTEINGILGTREENVKRMIDEMNAIRLINVEIKKINKSQGDYSSLSSAQQKRLEQLNNSLLTHKEALAEIRQTLNNNVKLDNVASTSMKGLSQSLSRMRIAYRELTEEERNSPFGKELLTSINQADAKIKELDATIGNHQRNVGNYGKQWNGLSMSIQQVGRELPSLAYGPKVFFSAISNNLPILADEIKRARIEYDLLKKSGQSATPVWKQVASSLFSWQTALTVGITLLTLYGDKAVDWVAGLFNAKNVMKPLVDIQQQLNDVQLKGVQNAQSEITKLELLYKATQNASKPIRERKKAVDELQKSYPDFFKNLSEEEILTGKAADAYARLTSSIIASARARAAQDKMTENAKKILENEAKITEEYAKRENAQLKLDKQIELRNKIDREANPDIYAGRQMMVGAALGKVEEIDEGIAKLRRDIYELNKSQNELAQNIDVNDLIFNPNEDSSKIGEKERKRRQEEAENRLKQQEQLAEQLLSLRRKNQQDEINLMADGTEKKLAQIDLDYQKELDAIRKQEQEWTKANGGKLTQEQFIQISLSYSQAESKRDKSISDLNKEKFESDKKAWQEYFIEFGNYQEKRKNLVQKYDDEIAKLHTDSPEYAIKVAEKNQAVEQLDEQFGHSAKAMADLFEDAGNKSVSAIQTIIDKYETLVKYMSGTKESDGTNVTLDELKALGFTDKDIEKIEKGEISIKDVTDAIRGLKDELKGKSPWQAFVSDLEKGIEAIKKGGNDSKKVGQGITDIGNAVTSFAPALGEFGTNIANIFGASDSAITGITDALGGLGTTAAGVGQIMSGDIVGGAMSAVSGMSSVVSALDGLFGADYSHYNEMVEQYSLLNDIWDELIDKKLEYINTSYGAEANKVGEEALELAEKSIESYRILGKERLNAGSSAGSHSIGVRIRKGMSEQGWEEARKALNDEQWFKEISTGRMESLFDLSTEQLERLKSEAPTFWAKLDEDVRNYLDKIIDGEERIEEIHNQINEQLTQTTFDGVYSNFIDTLMDMKASSKDAAEDISEYFMRAMLSEQVGALYQDKLKKWYEKFAKGMEDGSLTESERNALNAEYMGYIEEAMKLRDELAAATGYDKISQESTSQSASSKGFQVMSQDTGEELNGRFTALQIAGEEIKNQNIIQSQSLNLLTVKADALLSINTETRNIADDTRDLIAQSYLELVQISENTGAIVKPIIQIQKDMAEVKNNTSKL
jgi:hypothetical protein|uniref:Tail tape measure protein n=1 Tax=Siphoviridae sp. ctkcl3 TaxID=2826445 RepID=A0A8S5LYU0_9CAUD|nr:MAG TPA: tail tape measure protein [Siphoviridae sp. ctkcl3]DAV94679.1 MAG TPA: tail tape measure protein [Caudoviricetes sp.]